MTTATAAVTKSNKVPSAVETQLQFRDAKEKENVCLRINEAE